MGNAPSQPPVSDAVSSSLSPRAQQRLSQAPAYMNFFEAAAVAPSAPASRPKKRPPTTSDKSSTRSGSSNSSGRASNNDKRVPRSTATSISNGQGSVFSEGSSTLLSSLGASTDKQQQQQQQQQQLNKDLKLEYATIDERRYLCDPDARYFLPCDEEESDRLVIMHFMLKYAFGGNFKAPISDILGSPGRHRILDIGNGPGTWVLEMASDFPNTVIYGIDLVPMFPNTIKPKNAKFLHHNILKDLPFPDNSFDYVHMRLMLCNLTQAQLVHLLSEISRILKPSAFVELLDVEYRVQRPGPLTEALLNKKLYQTMRSHDVDFQLCHQLSTLLMTQGGGFIDVTQDRVTIPLGWGGQLGQIHAQNIETFYQTLHPLIRNATTLPEHPQGMTETVVRQAMLECQKYQSHLNWYTWVGQKPAADPTAAAVPTTPSTTSNGTAGSVVAMSPSSSTSSTTVSSTTSTRPTNNKRMVMAASGPAIVEETWESINEFIDGYVE